MAVTGYPTDDRIDRHPIFASLIDKLKPIKKKYEHDISWDMRR
jgi:RNA-dependent RNA polymerase